MLRLNALVKYNDSKITDYESSKLPRDFTDDTPLVFLGEIPNMSGHGIFATRNHTYIGYKISNFIELSQEEILKLDFSRP